MLGWLCSHVETGAPPDPPAVDNLDNWAALTARGVREHPKIAASVLERSVGSQCGCACGELRMSGGNDTRNHYQRCGSTSSAELIGKKTWRNLAEHTIPVFLCVDGSVMLNLDPAVSPQCDSSSFTRNENVNPCLKEEFRRRVGFPLTVEETIPNSCNTITGKRQPLPTTSISFALS